MIINRDQIETLYEFILRDNARPAIEDDRVIIFLPLHLGGEHKYLVRKDGLVSYVSSNCPFTDPNDILSCSSTRL